MRPFTTQRTLLNVFRTTPSRSISTSIRSVSTRAKISPFQLKPTKVAAGLTIGASIGIGMPWMCKTIYNDAILDINSPGSLQKVQEVGLPSKEPKDHKTTSRFNGKLDYRQLCYGSIIGVFLGVVVGKISSLLVFLTVSAYLGLQFLQNRGAIDKGSTQRLLQGLTIKTSGESIDLNTLIWERPSFKVSFLLTFVLAAVNI